MSKNRIAFLLKYFAISCLLPVFAQNATQVQAEAHRVPELIFHATFDGSAEAETAAGVKTPTRAENLAFDTGLQGQALRLNADAASLLEYKTQGNLRGERGCISMWIKRDLSKEIPWQVLLTQPWQEETRIGSGALWFWLYEGALRADTSDGQDRYLSHMLNRDERWHLVAMTWDECKKGLYLDGQLVREVFNREGNLAAPVTPFEYERIPYDSFLIGNYKGWSFNGLIDDLKIWSEPLDDETVKSMYQEHGVSITFRLDNRYQFQGEPIHFPVVANNSGSQPVKVTFVLTDTKKEKQSELTLDAVPGETPCQVPGDGLGPGVYYLEIFVNGEFASREPLWVFHATVPNNSNNSQNEYASSPWSSPLNLKLIEDMDMTAIPPERFSSVGQLHTGELNGVPYLETSNESGSRFAFRLHTLDVTKLYCLEFDWPDDKQRTIDVVVQSPRLIDGPDEDEYEFQVGCVMGDEYRNSNKIITQRCLLHPRSSDESILFMCARNTEGGAAIARVRLYEVVGGLPPANEEPASPVNDWTRTVGIYFEDPALGYDFGNFGYDPENYEGMIDRLIDYMKYSGQNMLAYPLVWYNGYIGDIDNPRQHPADFIEGILAKFDRAGLEFMATINQNNFVGIRPTRNFTMSESVPAAVRPYINGMPLFTQEEIDSGSLHDSPLTIQNTGLPHPSYGWHDSSPIFNPLHPAVQQMTKNNFREILQRCKDHPSFKGIILHLPRHSLNSFGDVESGYNDYIINAFEKATGHKVEVDREVPMRGQLYYEWLKENAWDDWLNWRCQALGNWYKELAAMLKEARHDLKLGINAMTPILYSQSHFDATDCRDFWGEINREAGIDAACFADVDNMFIEQTLFPADYRWLQDRQDPKIRERLRNTEETRGQYASLLRGHNAWVHQHDRYWESPIGKESRGANNPAQSLDTPWLKEHPWHVTTLNPLAFHAMKHYIMPLRYKDVQGLSKGGFLIGSYGMEEYLTPFIRAFRALPAAEFTELPGSSETVKARLYSDSQSTWFYFANTNAEPVEIEFQVPQGGTATCWAQTRFTADLSSKQHMTLAPYSLTVFRLEGSHTLLVHAIDSCP
ncbi:MAG: LamG-like jellyroll fold domain-containing protein [Planctomycetia bacterium]|nr:LamG-like jellyroll fold domain-containing protein [Planctomycetia bacterium]